MKKTYQDNLSTINFKESKMVEVVTFVVKCRTCRWVRCTSLICRIRVLVCNQKKWRLSLALTLVSLNRKSIFNHRKTICSSSIIIKERFLSLMTPPKLNKGLFRKNSLWTLVSWKAPIRSLMIIISTVKKRPTQWKVNSGVKHVEGVHLRLRNMPRISVKHAIRKKRGFREEIYRLSLIWTLITI